MATGMVFVIVTRHIDLSVGALLATCSAAMAMVQTAILPHWFGIELGSALIAPLAILSGLIVGGLIGALHGWLVGYLTIPAFIVTLGGLFVWRNVAWHLTDGQTIGPLDPTFVALGGIDGTLGETGSWILGVIAALFTLYLLFGARRNKIAHDFPVKPIWAEYTIAAILVAAILGFVWTLNSYEVPIGRLKRVFEEAGQTLPKGYTEGYGVPYSVILLIIVATVMTIVAQRTPAWSLHFRDRRQSGSGGTVGHQYPLFDGEDFHHRRGALCPVCCGGLGAPQLSFQRYRYAGRIACHRGGGDRRDGLVGWRRHDLWRHSGRAHHAVAAIGHGHGWR